MGKRNRRAIKMLAATVMLNTIIYCDSNPADSSENIGKFLQSHPIQRCDACQFPSLERGIIPGATRGDRRR